MFEVATNSIRRSEGKRGSDLRHGPGAGDCRCRSKPRRRSRLLRLRRSRSNPLDVLDYSKIVWPNPPAITRIKYTEPVLRREARDQDAAAGKGGWMDRLAGVAAGDIPQNQKLFFQLVTPYGMGVDSKGRIYIADEKVRAIFIFNPETKAVELIKNGVQARMHLITGLALDDSDRLFVSDSELRHVLVFDKEHKVEASISQGMVVPAGLAVDNENRFLYVADTDLDQVLVFDADPPYKFLRSIGTRSGKHDLTTPGDFSHPTNVAVDGMGTCYVSRHLQQPGRDLRRRWKLHPRIRQGR